jgi:hypothetical protein
MKKLTVLAVALIALASCRKDYTCECQYNDIVHGWKTETHNFQHDNTKEAKQLCEAGMGLLYDEFNCKLK